MQGSSIMSLFVSGTMLDHSRPATRQATQPTRPASLSQLSTHLMLCSSGPDDPGKRQLLYKGKECCGTSLWERCVCLQVESREDSRKKITKPEYNNKHRVNSKHCIKSYNSSHFLHVGFRSNTFPCKHLFNIIQERKFQIFVEFHRAF